MRLQATIKVKIGTTVRCGLCNNRKCIYKRNMQSPLIFISFQMRLGRMRLCRKIYMQIIVCTFIEILA